MIVSSNDNRLIINNDQLVLIAAGSVNNVVAADGARPLLASNITPLSIVATALDSTVFATSPATVVAAQGAQLLARVPPSFIAASPHLLDRVEVATGTTEIVARFSMTDYRSVVWHVDFVRGGQAMFLTIHASFNPLSLQPYYVVSSKIGDRFSAPLAVAQIAGEFYLSVENTSNTDVLIVRGVQLLALTDTGTSDTGAAQETFSAIAAMDLSAYAPVYLDNLFRARLADAADALIKSVIGLTKTSVTSGNTVEIITAGNALNSGFSFSPDKLVYLGNGAVSQTPPSTGLLQVLGVSTSINSFFLNIKQAIRL